MQKIIFILLSFIVLEARAVRDCPGDKVLYKPPGATASDCVCPPGNGAVNDLSLGPVTFGSCNTWRGFDIVPSLMPILWLDASDPYGTGVPPPYGTKISTWVDKSGNGNHATQTTGSLQPSYVNGPAGLQVARTRNVISFGGSQYLNINNTNFNSLDYSSGLTILGVFYANANGASGSGSGIIEKRASPTDTNSYALTVKPSSLDYKIEAINNTTSITNPNTQHNDWYRVMAYLIPNNTIVMFINMSGYSRAGGVTGTLSSSPTGPAIIGCRYGAVNCLNGYIAELIIYNKYIDFYSTTISPVKTYLHYKWGIDFSTFP